ncbi:MAG: multidrug efflux SMR transporter [Yaniella sp.]|uniref:DMT family transporter n=1 Tax=Yaniella sp. TaxID=2773929 RepID=UPI002648600A|nr:multidrug efflux SMR transporter [Yaniella sp.]MDN5889575.1 multidrug efflux SMR transporter [Yaniella sp.]MDN5913298.1 multidrug efflux SMR transporter [Yaniella sp.]MDN6358484.1 multidrug efflux SMR transporter [Yaniella sp.]MDN6457213.1 multidrug efflux SMR transporter [Yaniella sp.]MDN6490771.1 multidrug efflux SMR transporter [Yaniella sp.]
MSWVYLSLAIIAEILGTLSLRAADGFRKKLWVVPLVVFYGLAFYLLALTLAAGMPVAIAYGIWSAIGVALIAILARIIWKEPLTPRMLLGLALIMIGVLLVEIG